MSKCQPQVQFSVEATQIAPHLYNTSIAFKLYSTQTVSKTLIKTYQKKNQKLFQNPHITYYTFPKS